MTLECINPKDLPTPQTYTQVVVATGSKMVFVSGQEPEDIHGKLVGLVILLLKFLWDFTYLCWNLTNEFTVIYRGNPNPIRGDAIE